MNFTNLLGGVTAARDSVDTRGEAFGAGVRERAARGERFDFALRDAMRAGDRGFFYHSGCAKPGIAGLCEICSEVRVDPTQFDPASPYHDPAATPDKPRWLLRDVRFLARSRLLGLAELRSYPTLSGMRVLARGNRLSITPVSVAEWNFIVGSLLELPDFME